MYLYISEYMCLVFEQIKILNIDIYYNILKCKIYLIKD